MHRLASKSWQEKNIFKHIYLLRTSLNGSEMPEEQLCINSTAKGELSTMNSIGNKIKGKNKSSKKKLKTKPQQKYF